MTPEDILNAKSLLTVVGDVHGERSALQPILVAAAHGGRHLVFLGDLVDRGPDSAGVLADVLPLILNGKASWVRGNHDDKLMRHIMGRNVSIDGPLRETIRQLDAAPIALRDAYVDAWSLSRLWLTWRNFIFVHGAYHPNMASKSAVSFERGNGLTALALYGETTGERGENGFPVRTYGWVASVPAGCTVIVGHDALSMDAPVEKQSDQGGRVIFLDTGAGKGGRLSALDLPELLKL